MLPLWLNLLALTLPAPALAQVPAPVAVVPVGVLLEREPPPQAPPVAVMVDSVALRVSPGDESTVELDIALRALEPGWVDLAVTGGALAVSSAALDGRPVALQSREGGERWLTAELHGEHRLRVRGSVATPTASLDLPLPLASRARVELVEPGWDLEVEGGIPTPDGAVLLASSSRVRARWQPHAAPAPKPRVITVESATAVSFDESGLEGRATLRYLVAHGAVERVSFDLAGDPDSVEVSGAAVRSFARRGGRVEVELARPMEGGFELQVAFRAPPPGDDRAHTAPLVSPSGVFEHSGWVTVARADTAMLVPEPRGGLEAVPGSTLPPWATGLVPGTPVVSYALSGRSPALGYRLLGYDPVAAPPTVVDEARFQLATTEHGRALMKARYTVRNDRNQYLRLQPPAGFEVLGVRVAGEVRQPVADGGAVYIPLEKSVESLQGLISFPVEVYLLGDEAAWDRKGQRSLSTPAVDAPVAYARWELWLPTEVEWQELSGLPKHVVDWTSGEHSLEYGRAVRAEGSEDDGGWEEDDDRRVSRASQLRNARREGRDKDAAPVGSSSSAKADAAEDASLELFNQAYRAYNSNDFDQAQQLLEQSLQLDEGNASAHALLGNVMVVTGQGGETAGGDETQARRVRELARARAVDDELEQKQLQKKAEEALRAGDYEMAERELERLEAKTRDLSRLEQRESVEQQRLLEETAKQLEATRGKLEEKKKRAKVESISGGSGVVAGGSAGYAVSAAGMAAPATPLAEPVEIVDRFATLVLEEPSVEPYPEAEPDQAGALYALGYMEEAEESWDEEEVYFEDIDEDAYDEPVRMAQVASVEAYRPGARAAGAVGDALRGVGQAFGRRKEQASYSGVALPPAEPAPPVSGSGGGGGRGGGSHGMIDFESVTIEGELVKPQGVLLQDRQRSPMQPLIDLRADFHDELSGSTTDVGGGGWIGQDASAAWADAGPSEPIVMGFGEQSAPPPERPSKDVDAERRNDELEAILRGEREGYIVTWDGDDGALSGVGGGIGGLIGTKGTQIGSGGLGVRGSGLGGGGSAEGLGGLGTKGRGGGTSGYGTGGASFGAGAAASPPPPPPEPCPEPEPVAAPVVPVVAFGPPPADPPAVGRKDPASAKAHGNVVRGPVTTARRQIVDGVDVTDSSLPAPAESVSAAHLTINIPKAGERLAFEQLLVAENQPMTIDIRYRTRSRR